MENDNSLTRPEHLPNFSTPPLDEVVLGVQFAPVPNYSSVNANDIWRLFKTQFPKIQEQSLLDPKFETFGGANPQPGFQFQLGTSPIGSRLWFFSEDENHLLQFQSDRFLINWRKNSSSQGYPRFEVIYDSFKSNLLHLAQLLEANFSYKMEVNQTEITYVNVIPVENFSDASEWINVWNDGHFDIESINMSFNEIITDTDNRPYARLSHEVQSVLSVDGKQKALRLSLTYRGKPYKASIDDAMNFLKDGRVKIVNRFDEITTEKAHKTWGKI